MYVDQRSPNVNSYSHINDFQQYFLNIKQTDKTIT